MVRNLARTGVVAGISFGVGIALLAATNYVWLGFAQDTLA